MLYHIWAWIATHAPRDERGQDAAEYALLIGLIALAVVAAVTLLGGNLSAVYTAIAGAVGPWVP